MFGMIFAKINKKNYISNFFLRNKKRSFKFGYK